MLVCVFEASFCKDVFRLKRLDDTATQYPHFIDGKTESGVPLGLVIQGNFIHKRNGFRFHKVPTV